MSEYKRIIREEITEEVLREASISSTVAKILSKLAKLAGADKEIIRNPEIQKAVKAHAEATEDFRKAIENYERKYGKVPDDVKRLVQI